MRTSGGRWSLKSWSVKSAWVFCISTRFDLSLSHPYCSFNPNLVSIWYFTCRVAQYRKDEFMTKWNTALGDTFISNTSLKLLTVSIPSPLLASELLIGKLSPCTSSIFLLEHVDILLPLYGTSNRPCHAAHRPLSHARTLEGERLQAVSFGHHGRHERL